MGPAATKQLPVILRSSLQRRLQSAKLSVEVTGMLKIWQECGAPLALLQATFSQVLGELDEGGAGEALFVLLDTDRNQKVDAFELLSASILLSEGPLDEKVDMLFSVFDFSGAGRLNFDELNIMFASAWHGLSKVCDLAPQSSATSKSGAAQPIERVDAILVRACRQSFDSHNLPYDQTMSHEQLKRWVRHDVEASAWLGRFQNARTPQDMDAAVLQFEERQVAAFHPLCTPGTAEAPLDAVLASSDLRQAFASVLQGASAGVDGAIRQLFEAMAQPGGLVVTASRFAEGARAWNAFGAIDASGTGHLPSAELPLLLWLATAEREPSPPEEEPGETAVQECLDSLGLPRGDDVERAAWLAAQLRAKGGAPA
mmetsp:Transcript_109684/g.317137  ORF Transcript_109684/g.317137 Transcript_109684/m.317137 type:complete len:371 (+) Transcript_109684:80-1192(+)